MNRTRELEIIQTALRADIMRQKTVENYIEKNSNSGTKILKEC